MRRFGSGLTYYFSFSDVPGHSYNYALVAGYGDGYSSDDDYSFGYDYSSGSGYGHGPYCFRRGTYERRGDDVWRKL